MERRKFIKTLTAAGAAVNLPILRLNANGSSESLDILVLGGTKFVGPAIVNSLRNAGHQVTLANRGITNPQLFPDLKLTRTDREGGIDAYRALKEKKWDVVVDVWPEKSQLVEEATTALVKHTSHYVFISSIAVYNDFQEVGLHEESDVVSLENEQSEWSYSEEKLASENIVKKRFPDKHTILRPGPIKGWRDDALDLAYWCIKLTRDISIIAPGSGADPIQFIDVKDVGSCATHLLENKQAGTFNCTGPLIERLLWKDFLLQAKTHFDSQTELIWASEKFLQENQVASFSDLPLWAPLSEDKGFMQISNEKLVNTGFVFTPIEKTLDNCLKWAIQSNGKNIQFGTEALQMGLSKPRELELISKLD